MSIAAREAICAPGSGIFFQNEPVQRLDLLDPAKTDSNLIAMLEHIRAGGYYVEITAVRSDHHDDGSTEHAGGLAVDLWPLTTPIPGRWMDASSPDFQRYLAHVAKFAGLRNIGLAGSAYTDLNVQATGLELTNAPEMAEGPCVFEDNGDDHLHHDVVPA